MAGSGFVWGGLLQGLGQGLAAKGQSDLEERRRIALESLRHGNAMAEASTEHGYRMEQAQTQADLNDRNNAREVERNTSSKIVVDGVETKNRIKLEGFKAVQDQALARLKAQLDQANDNASQKLKTMLEAGTVQSVQVAEDGAIMVVKKNGTLVNTGVKAAPKDVVGSQGLGAGGVLGGLGVNGDQPAPAAPAPVRKPTNPAPLGNGAGSTRAGGGTVRAPNGNRPPITSFYRN